MAQQYSDTLMEHFLNPRNAGPLEQPDLIGCAGKPGSAPFMVLQLRLDGIHIIAAKFATFGCGPAIASGSVLTELIVNRTVADAVRLTRDDVIAALDGMPLEKSWCADLPIKALRAALKPRFTELVPDDATSQPAQDASDDD